MPAERLLDEYRDLLDDSTSFRLLFLRFSQQDDYFESYVESLRQLSPVKRRITLAYQTDLLGLAVSIFWAVRDTRVYDDLADVLHHLLSYKPGERSLTKARHAMEQVIDRMKTT